jgi:predicted RND superfamily exporter protein
MTITIAAVAMGILMDDTIHYIYRYLAKDKVKQVEQALT